MSKVVRLDDDVWRALQALAAPFEDTPNTVLRRLLHIDNERRHDEKGNQVFSGVAFSQFIENTKEISGMSDSFNYTKNGSVKLKSKRGKVFGYVSYQTNKARVKIEIRKDWAEAGGLDNWDRILPNGWFNTGIDSVYWFVPDGDQVAAKSRAEVIATLAALDL